MASFTLITIMLLWKVYWLCSLVLPGTSEAFLHAVANENQLKKSNDMLLLFSVIYIFLNVVFIKSAGAVGLIAANCISILLLQSMIISFLQSTFSWTTWLLPWMFVKICYYESHILYYLSKTFSRYVLVMIHIGILLMFCSITNINALWTLFTGFILLPALLASRLGHFAHFWPDHSFLREGVSESWEV